MAVIAAGHPVVAAKVVEAVAVGMGGDRREDQESSEAERAEPNCGHGRSPRRGCRYFPHSTATMNPRALAAMYTGGRVEVEVDPPVADPVRVQPRDYDADGVAERTTIGRMFESFERDVEEFEALKVCVG